MSSCTSPPCNDTDVDELKNGGPSAGHGTHVAGIMAAYSSINISNIGVAGACWNCSLVIGKISGGILPKKDAVLIGMDWLVSTGAQAINLSINDYTSNYSLDCSTKPSDSWCEAIGIAEDNDVVFVNASGNGNGCSSPITPPTCAALTSVRPPGSDERVLSIGAYDPYTSLPAGFSDFGARLDLLAPGVDILSTFYTGFPWNTNWSCRDTMGGYGTCTGTSMAAPHITGLVGLLRSANPLLSRTNIKDILTYNASGQGTRIDNNWGYGIPDAEKAVKAALGKIGTDQLNNRLTPLFSLYSDAAKDYFYTTVPQMAIAAKEGTLQPQPPSPAGPVYYTTAGAATPGYWGPPCSFGPCPFGDPKASVYIFTTDNLPFTGTPDLVPLYRLSYQGDYVGDNPNHVDHTYAISDGEVAMFKSWGYQLDGIEGYIYGR